MDIGSILLILGLLLLVALYISQPLMKRSAINTRSADHETSALLAERDRIINTLQELDFDHTLGKIPEEIYPAQRAALLQRGAAVLQKIDVLLGATGQEEASARLEAAVETQRPDAKESQTGILEDDELEALIARRRRERKSRSIGFCPQCGNPLQQADKFCPKCGAALG